MFCSPSVSGFCYLVLKLISAIFQLRSRIRLIVLNVTLSDHGPVIDSGMFVGNDDQVSVKRFGFSLNLGSAVDHHRSSFQNCLLCPQVADQIHGTY